MQGMVECDVDPWYVGRAGTRAPKTRCLHSSSTRHSATHEEDQEKIQKQHENNEGSSARKRIRAANFEEVDKCVYRWLLEVRSKDIPISGPVLCAKAREFAVMCGVEEKLKGTQEWLRAFRARHGIVFKCVSGEERSAPQDDVQGWRDQEMKQVLSQYAPEDIFNADETALFFKLLPECTLAVKNDNCKGGKKSKERISVLLCCNMTGTAKLKPLVIGKSRNPRAFKNVRSLYAATYAA
ncbi:tigger transposable element-derived protein 6-like [Ornithodoros turicata]|uniref:tigger transposable element-derived protein 6-like n=1 Tax=Ornithodoros turicata TaxID=34597 RepID=UPI003139EEBA